MNAHSHAFGKASYFPNLWPGALPLRPRPRLADVPREGGGGGTISCECENIGVE